MHSPVSPYSYKAVCDLDSFTNKRRAMFFASAVDISLWSGIPQKMILDGGDGAETIGFQRVESLSRVNDIRKFYTQRENSSPNPILCAVRSPADGAVLFEALENDGINNSKNGIINISLARLEKKDFTELFGMLRQALDARIIEEADKSAPSEAEINTLKRSLYKGDEDTEDFDLLNSAQDEQESSSFEADEVPSIESHIVNFRKAIAIREILCQQGAADGLGEFAGFTKDRLISFLLPIVLVDGQHRLRGALAAAHEALETEEMQEKQAAIFNGLNLKYTGMQLDAELEAEKLKLLRSVSPVLPISLLLDADPAEQVFQFVVVNQKSVPVGKALLGTIVSTTLTENELDIVRTRLTSAGIPLENSRAMTKLVVDPCSPFYEKVDRGLKKELSANLLQWTVFSGLVQIVRTLQGARFYHEDRGLDYALCWKETYLPESGIASKYQEAGFSSPAQYWASNDGPWEEFFLSFFSEVKKRLANSDSEEADNYWGKPKDSNIFNKVYLNILLTDFFEYLYTKEVKIASKDEMPEIVESWLSGASSDYFSRNWSLKNVKKDSTATKKTWSALWHNYRRTPEFLKKLPTTKSFTQ